MISLFSKQLINEFPIKAIHKTLYTAVPSRFSLVSLAAVFSIVTQRSRDDTKNVCEGD